MDGMSRRTVWIVVAIVVLAGAAIAVWFAGRLPSEDARALLDSLPPDADAYAVVDMDVLQSNPAVRQLLADPPDLTHSAEYQQLLRETGFRYQQHLRRFAFAVFGSDWAGIAVADFEQPRFTSYLESQGASKSDLHGRRVYTFGAERPFRLAFLDDRQVAFAVGADSAHLEAVLDRAAGLSAGSAKDDLTFAGVMGSYPSGAGLWVFGRMDRLVAKNPQGPDLGPMQLGKDWWQGSRTLLASVVSSPLHLDVHLENQCDSAASAQHMAAGFSALLTILKAVQPPKGSQKPDYTPLLAAIAIRQQESSVYLDWHWDPSMIALLMSNR
jgi:hypothetical protein